MCACEHPEQMYLQLRGLCPDSNIDQFYVPRNKPKTKKLQLIGFKTSIIEHMGVDVGWKLEVNGLLQNTTAITEASLESYVLGTHKWQIKDDNTECSKKGQPYTRLLKLTGCREGEFTCSDGQCIRGQTLKYQTKAEWLQTRTCIHVFTKYNSQPKYQSSIMKLSINFPIQPLPI